MEAKSIREKLQAHSQQWVMALAEKLLRDGKQKSPQAAARAASLEWQNLLDAVERSDG